MSALDKLTNIDNWFSGNESENIYSSIHDYETDVPEAAAELAQLRAENKALRNGAELGPIIGAEAIRQLRADLAAVVACLRAVRIDQSRPGYLSDDVDQLLTDTLARLGGGGGA